MNVSETFVFAMFLREGTLNGSSSKPAKNKGICSVLTRQHAKNSNVFKQNSRFFTSCSSVEKSIIRSSGLVGGIGYWVLEKKWGRQSGPKNALL